MAFIKNSKNVEELHVLVHSECYTYPKGSETITSKVPRNNYIHPKLDCILRRYPYYDVELLKYSSSISNEEKSHFEYALSFAKE